MRAFFECRVELKVSHKFSIVPIYDVAYSPSVLLNQALR